MTSDGAASSAPHHDDSPDACPICASAALRRTVYRLRPFDVVECRACGGLQRDPLPSADEMEGYYRDPVYIEGGYFADAAASTAGGGQGSEGPEIAIFREALEFLALRRRRSGLEEAGNLLDVGAGAGTFLELAAAQGWRTAGIELSPELASRAEARSGSRVVAGDFTDVEIGGGPFDAITMWDVLEHTADPGAFLDRARGLLAPGGVLVVFTIDAASLFNVVADLAWRLTARRVVRPLELLYDKRHNHYFTARTLATLLERHGLFIEEVRSHRAHLGRWLSEPASRLVLAGAEVIDLLSVPLRRPYRQLLYCGLA